jgi:choline kinase
VESVFGYLLAVAFDIHKMLFFIDGGDDEGSLSLIVLKKLFEELAGQNGRVVGCWIL